MKVQQYPKPKLKKHRAKNNPAPTINDLCAECLREGITTPYAASHEVFYGPYRQASIEYKMQYRLCPFHHQDSTHGIHFDREFDYRISKMYQQIFIEQHGLELLKRVFGDNMAAKELKHENHMHSHTQTV
jgi:hypothetical protein